MKQDKITCIDTQQQIVISLRAKVSGDDLPAIIGDSYGKLSGFIQEQNGHISGTPFTAYHGLDENNQLDETKEIDIEIGFPVQSTLESKENFQCRVIPGGKAVCCDVQGDYHQLAEVYAQIAQWLREHNCRSLGSTYEYYFSGPNVPKDQHKTRIVMPIHPE